MEEIEFKPWDKIARGKDQHITITEKLNGTNACVIIKENKVVGVQSRTRLITPETDNYGFAQWVYDNKNALEQLGDGYHYGEWYGEGIQKNPHRKNGKHLALFNTFRFHEDNPLPENLNIEIVPILYTGPQQDITVDTVMETLKILALEAEYIPEGVIIYYHNTRTLEKYTFKNADGKWVSLQGGVN